MSRYKGIPIYPCPHDRELTDAELERIRFAGEKMLDVDKRNKPKLPGDEWKEE